jgi:DNA-binding MarR family transcriptional regulator
MPPHAIAPRSRHTTRAIGPGPRACGDRSGSVNPRLDDLLEALQSGDLSPLELRMLLVLSQGGSHQAQLAELLNSSPGGIRRAARRLSVRGLIARRYERGRHSRFLLTITPSGLRAVGELVELLPASDASGDQRD